MNVKKISLFLLIVLSSLVFSETSYKHFFKNIEGNQLFNKNLTDGPKNFYFPDGTIKSEQFFINGKKSGIWKFYFKNGNLKTEILFFPLSKSEEGFVKNYDKNGVIVNEGFISNGTTVSLWKYYDENGKLHHSFDYSKGEIEIYDENEKSIDKFNEVDLAEKLVEIQKEIRDDRIRSFQNED